MMRFSMVIYHLVDYSKILKTHKTKVNVDFYMELNFNLLNRNI